MTKAPETCLYCKGTGWQQTVGVMNAECGFCDNGKPLDTQEDWDKSWGGLESRHAIFPECPLCSGPLTPEHAHFKCKACGFRDSCCD